MCADRTHPLTRGQGKKGKQEMAYVSMFDKVALLVTMEARGLPRAEAHIVREALDACIAEGWIVPSGDDGWVLSMSGLATLAGFRALLAPLDESESE